MGGRSPPRLFTSDEKGAVKCFVLLTTKLR